MKLPVNLLIGLGAAVVLAAGLMASRGMIAGTLVAALAAAGLLLRWSRVPPLVLLATAYLSFFPEGLPAGEPVGRGFVSPNLLDLLTAVAAVVYVSAHYRYATQAAEDGDEPDEDTLAALFIGAGASVLGGIVAVYLTTGLVPDYDRGPLRFVRVRVDPGSLRAVDFDSGELLFARAVMLAGLIGFAALTSGLVLWLTRLNRLSPAEARLALLDVQWKENRRELARLETWRAAVKQPEPRRRKRRYRSCLVAVLMSGAAFLLFACLIRWVRS